MQVRKRNGFIRNFKTIKIEYSIINSANDVGIFLTESDIKLLVHEILYMITKVHKDSLSRVISTYELKGMVYCALINEGFSEVAESYMDIAFKKYS